MYTCLHRVVLDWAQGNFYLCPFFLAQQAKSGLGRHVFRLLDHIQVDHTQLDTLTHTRARGRAPLNESPTRRKGRYLHNTQQTQETNILALSWIRTRHPNSQATADLRLRPRSHRDRPQYHNKIKYYLRGCTLVNFVKMCSTLPSALIL
jgi:hypothetical protein